MCAFFLSIHLKVELLFKTWSFLALVGTLDSFSLVPRMLEAHSAAPRNVTPYGNVSGELTEVNSVGTKPP